ncbi:hypothetical protein BN946_scf184830.g7, partial [Trametes cinnabarina]
MHRVRLLRHYGIEPYLVFDGGPLPAKQGTESERKQRREENLSRANALAAQGKHSQAREYYVKCVDVTPQMAYQLIKVRKLPMSRDLVFLVLGMPFTPTLGGQTEGVPYIVAPYEADAQLAYLERIGLVDGIITEDSDLLVFGCKTVLYKLDITSSTVTCISRDDFASVESKSAGGLSLVGWTDTQFRAMAILSGCDYLPSIPGIGLKTAWTLLRKHKTVETMLNMLRLEGKKKIPKDYLDAFRLAEKVFLYQRVYDPTQERLVHLTPLPDGEPWDAEKEAYVGAHIEPSLAKRVAEGDACPITLLPMEDINPSFIPRALKPIPMNAVTPAGHRPDKGKGRAKDSAPTPGKPNTPGPLMKFFELLANYVFSYIAPAAAQVREVTGASASGVHASPLGAASERGRPSPKPPSASKPTAMVVGMKSGKRTLSDVMQEDMAAKRKRHDGVREAVSREQEKENVPCDEADADTEATAGDDEADEDPGRSTAGEDGWDDEFDADVLSSPPVHRHTRRPPPQSASVTVERAVTRALPLVPLRAPRFGGGSDGSNRRRDSANSASGYRETQRDEAGRGPDLRDVFDDWDEVTSGGEDDDWFAEREDGIVSTASSTPGPITPAEDVTAATGDEDVKMSRSVAAESSSGELEDVNDDTAPADAIDCDELEASATRHANARVAHGWWAKWARSGTVTGAASPALARADAQGGSKGPGARVGSDRGDHDDSGRSATTPSLHCLLKLRIGESSVNEEDLRATGRTRLTFRTEDVGTTPKAGSDSFKRGAPSSRPVSARGSREAEAREDEEDHDSARARWAREASASRTGTTSVSSRNRNSLEQFRRGQLAAW